MTKTTERFPGQAISGSSSLQQLKINYQISMYLIFFGSARWGIKAPMES